MKHETFYKYQAHDIDLPQRALLTAWDCLNNYHDDLVLAGGLAIKFLTTPPELGLPGPVTLDVDFCIDLAADSGMYGNIAETLSGHGFRWKDKRFVRDYDGVNLYIDLITDDGTANTGTKIVDDSLPISSIPGVAHALKTYRWIEIKGKTLVGAESIKKVKVAEVGPMLALKLNAFGGPNGRKAPKDAHDIYYLAMHYLDGVGCSIAGYHTEREKGNLAVKFADQALKNFFLHEDSEGSLAFAAFRQQGNSLTDEILEETLAIRAQLVTLAHELLDV